MFLSTSHGDIQLSVNYTTIYFVFKYIIRKKTELVIFLNGESIDNILPLGALISLHGIYRNIV